MTRAVIIPPFTRPDGTALSVDVFAELVHADTGRPVTGYTAAGGILSDACIESAAEPRLWLLHPNADISPATRYRVTIHEASRATPPVDCTLPAGEEPIELWAWLGIGLPDAPADLWQQYLLSPDERAALSAATDPSGSNRLMTAADVTAAQGVPEAPTDGAQYARQSGGWAVVAAGSGDVEEAPADGTPYARQDAAWTPVSTIVGPAGPQGEPGPAGEVGQAAEDLRLRPLARPA
jgi:hypothetical protein